MALKSIKNKIRSTNKTRKVTKAMEAVSAVKMRKSQGRALDGRAYAASALTILKRLSGSFDGSAHPLAEERQVQNSCIILVTSDKGLAGGLNSAILKRTRELISEKNLTPENTETICTGRKGYEFFTKRNFPVRAHYLNVSDEISVDEMREVTDIAAERFQNGAYDAVYLVYTNFLSTFEQSPVVREILPLRPTAIAEIVRGIVPAKGAYAGTAEADYDAHINEYTVEPSSEEVLAELLPILVNIEVYHALLESKASEHSARMVAMKSASDKAGEMSHALNLEFNKERQALITREVSEIIGGIEALN